MTVPPRHPRFERAAAALRENLKRRKAQSRARILSDGPKDDVDQGQKSGSKQADGQS